MWLFFLSVFFFAIIAVARPRVALIFLLAFVPSFLIRGSIGPIPTTFFELGIYVLVAVTVARACVQRRFLYYSRPLFSGKNTLSACLIGLFVLSALVAAVFSPAHRASFGAVKGWVIDPLLLAWLVYLEVRAARTWEHVIVALNVSVLWLSVWGIIEKLGGFGLTVGTRLDSVFESPNYFAMYVGPVLAMNIALVFLGAGFIKGQGMKLSRYARGIIVITIVCGAGALYYAQSFGGWLALGGVVIYLLLRTKFHTVVWWSLGLIIAVVIAVSLNNPTLPARFEHVSDFTGQSSISVRIQIWRAAEEMIKAHPIVGIGPGNFGPSYAVYVYKVARSPWELGVIKAHNVFLNMWAEQGLLGLLSFLALIGYFYYRKPALWFGVAMAVILIHGLVDTTYFKNDLSVLFWIIYMGSLV